MADRHQDRNGQPARQPLRGRPRVRRVEGRTGLRPVRPHRHQVRHHGRPAGKATRSRSAGTCTPRPPRDTPPPATPTGIDYLRLLEDRQTRALGERLRYAQLTEPPRPSRPGPQTATRASTAPTTTGCVTTPTCHPARLGAADRGDRMSLTSFAPSTVSPAPRSAVTSQPGCCTATPGTPKRSPGSAGASTKPRSA